MTNQQATDPLTWLLSLEGVQSAYAAARDGIDVLLRDRGLRRTSMESTAESLLLGAHASAALEGSTSTLDELRGGHGDSTAQASARLSTQLLGMTETLSRTPLQAFARIHTVIAAGSLSTERLGRPRDDESSARLRDVATLLTTPTSAPALLVAALVHGELATAEPFASHNGMIARAVERLIVSGRGVDEKSVVPTELGHLRLRETYESNLRGYGSGGAAGMHAWVLYAAEAYTAAAEASPVSR